MEKATFTSGELPEHFDDLARFASWHEFFESLVCCIDLAKLDAVPFLARFETTCVDDVQINRFDGTLSRIARTAASISRGPDDRFCFVLNRGHAPLCLRQIGGREAILPTGAATLIQFDVGCETLAHDRSDWFAVTVCHERLLSALNGDCNRLLYRRIDESSPALRILGHYLESATSLAAAEVDLALEQHISSTIVDLIALSLGATGDPAESARSHGLRAGRLLAVLQAIKADYADPALSSQAVAHGLGLSRRYVNDLLYETGSSFSERVLELRLQKARAMLTSPQGDSMKVSDIAYACGFNEVSYFNRCFRRRFGASPTQFRADGNG